MKALRMAAPATDATTSDVDEVDAPTPGPGQVSIDVAYAGINFIDVMARRGDPGYATAWPYVPGLEVAGTVRAVAADVTDLVAGQRVSAFTAGGGLAEVAVADAALTVAVPDAVAPELAAGTPLAVGTALLLLDRAGLRAGESVLMHSASGGVGTMVSQAARLRGSGRRIGTVGRSSKIEAGLAAGWDDVVARDADDPAAAIGKVTPDGVDVILDPTGTGLLELDLSVAAPGARIVLFGNAGGGTPAPLPAMGRLIGGNVGVLGFSISKLSGTRPRMVRDALAEGLALLADERLTSAVTVVDSLADVPAVHDLLARGAGTGKYVARVTGGN